ncbi:putative bifunctional diguanylate cyclase/phosphodiesterase [Marinobacter sp. C2H3]|uniref:putative bifunctional diguanylate cyclase/phosphodiesterase n=1 Tax=Marinobacter sp. C2H3 TaxID=3119003 RepID=UPI00300F1B9D
MPNAVKPPAHLVDSKFLALSEAAVDGIITIDRRGVVTSFNRSAEQLFQYTRDEVLGGNVSMLMPTETAVHHDAYIEDHLNTGHTGVIGVGRKVEGRRRDGHTFPMYLSVGKFEIDGDVGFVGICHDLTEHYTALQRLRRSEERYHDIVESQSQMVCRLDRSLRLTFLNRALSELIGRAPERALGYRLDDLGGNLSEEQQTAMQALVRPRGHRQELNLVIRFSAGDDARFIQWRFHRLPSDDEEIQGFGIDVSDRERALLEATYLQTHDQLTGALNARAFLQALQQNIAQKRQFSVMAFDFDSFGLVNQKHGHHVGDALLLLAAQRIRSVLLRPAIVGRFGADEFFVGAPVTGAQDAHSLAESIRQPLAQPYDIDGDILHLSASGGFALFPTHTDSPDQLTDLAESALKDAKRQKRSLVAYDAQQHVRLQRRLDILQRLKTALRDRRLEVYFQHKYRFEDGGLAGCEALLRWQDPVLGWVSPGEFIPAAEATPMGEEIDGYVIDRVLALLADQKLPCATVGVNITADHFAQPDFATSVIQKLRRHGLPGSALQLEITEGVLMNRTGAVSGNLQQLREAGVTVAIDDFGSGYSSLSYLRNLMVDELKIDKTFVDAVDTDEGATVVHAIVDIGRAFNLKVVAEGVETPDQWHRLRELGCDVGQGYLMHRPEPAAGALTHRDPFSPPGPIT